MEKLAPKPRAACPGLPITSTSEICPRYCSSLVKNQYHNGHPDLLPTGVFPGNAVQYAQEGIKVKVTMAWTLSFGILAIHSKQSARITTDFVKEWNL
jgi:hypothetical protein